MRRFARVVTNVVVARPSLWRLFRPIFRQQWNRLAPSWDQTRRPDSFAPCMAGLALLPEPPAQVLDVGTGTGGGALAIAGYFHDAEIVGVDLSDEMVARAGSKLTPELARRLSFRQADASALPFADASFDLVSHNNMIPFFDEVARVVRPGGHALFAFSSGVETPIYVPFDRLETELRQRGFSDFAQRSAGRGLVFLARMKRPA